MILTLLKSFKDPTFIGHQACVLDNRTRNVTKKLVSSQKIRSQKISLTMPPQLSKPLVILVLFHTKHQDGNGARSVAEGKVRIPGMAHRKCRIHLRVLPDALPGRILPLSAPSCRAQGQLGQVRQGQPAFCRPEGRSRLLHLQRKGGKCFKAPF